VWDGHVIPCDKVAELQLVNFLATWRVLILTTASVDLSVIIPALKEGPNLAILLPQLQEIVGSFGIDYEVLVITHEADLQTREAAALVGARVVEQVERGFGGALLSGFAAAKGTYIVTMDADLSHPPTFVRDLWLRRRKAEVLIASRYVPGGSARMAISRKLLSRVLNKFFRRGLSLPVSDLSSNFRLYRADILRGLTLAARDFDILPEILIRIYAEGWKTEEVAFAYTPREHGSSNARVFNFGLAYLRTFGTMWKLRNSILSGDYDDRAYDSVIPLQRYWQRTRFRHVVELMRSEGPVLDVGCGSSRIIGALPPGSVALDVLLRKLRYARKFPISLVCGSGFSLPFADSTFPCVVCSQVVEHVPKDSPILDELCRVLAPGGRLVLGTPDYARWEWVWMEKLYGKVAPGAYADEHITHYSRAELARIMEERGFKVEAARYILRGELIMAFRKPV
jgi:dolichol-phosphate mannosyltransferase